MVPRGARWCRWCPVVPIEKLSDQGVSSFVSFGTDNTKLFSPTIDLDDGVLGSDDTKKTYIFLTMARQGWCRVGFLILQPHFAAF
ncbi:hypothetical protein Hanom_Chr01g00057411 [Helianthus anomalus]